MPDTTSRRNSCQIINADDNNLITELNDGNEQNDISVYIDD